MRLVIQRVDKASVCRADTGELVGSIGRGLLCLLGISRDDHWEDAEYCIRKCLKGRYWADAKDEQKSWHQSVLDLDLEVLIVSQFTLYGNTKKGCKPDFHAAMEPVAAKIFFDRVLNKFKESHKPERISTGDFGQYMKVELVNDGPVTIFVDSAEVQLNRSPKARTPTKKQDENVAPTAE
eukprot:GHVT01087662.1.p2 GENE.GHVT01087662.1~~GHVT01087662.1.p2  ORF type:complete len:180 (+),score=14.63 GHVT01087662.1:352-891(+)